MSQKHSEARRLWWASLSEEEKTEINRKRSESAKKRWARQDALARKSFGKLVWEAKRKRKGDTPLETPKKERADD